MKIFIFAVAFSSVLVGCLSDVAHQTNKKLPCEQEDYEEFAKYDIQTNLDDRSVPAIPKAVVDEQIAKQYSGDHLLNLKDQLDNDQSPDTAGGDWSQYQKYYYPVCPAHWYKVTYWQWFFSYREKKCFPIHNIWISTCVYKFCNISFTWDDWWWYHRCSAELRWVYTPVVCVTSTGQWSKDIIRHYLPKGCCCRRFWRWGLSNSLQCPASP